jgi:hypothetical protein
VRCNLPTLIALLTLATPLAGQAKPGHVYVVGYYQVVPGKAQDYSKAIADVSIPVFEELVKRKTVVSYLFLAQSAGTGEYTNLALVELANWARLDGFEEKLNEATQAVLHKSWGDATAGFPELRRFIRFEHYVPAQP